MGYHTYIVGQSSAFSWDRSVLHHIPCAVAFDSIQYKTLFPESIINILFVQILFKLKQHSERERERKNNLSNNVSVKNKNENEFA